MSLPDLKTMDAPRLHIILGNAAQIQEAAEKAAVRWENFAVKIMHGKKMQSRAALLEEFATVLKFPSYYGKNWDALEECLSDLEWMPAEGYVLLILDATNVLSEAPDQMFILSGILDSVSATWSAKKEARPFHVILCGEPNEEILLEQRLAPYTYSVDVA